MIEASALIDRDALNSLFPEVYLWFRNGSGCL
jgi:hypothetical protein